MASDGLGAAIFVWIDQRSGTSNDLYAQSLNFLGTPLWIANGIPIAATTQHEGNIGIVSDGVGGAIISWQYTTNLDDDIYVQRVDAMGGNYWATNGIVVAGGADPQIKPVITSDGNSGAIIACCSFALHCKRRT